MLSIFLHIYICTYRWNLLSLSIALPPPPTPTPFLPPSLTCVQIYLERCILHMSANILMCSGKDSATTIIKTLPLLGLAGIRIVPSAIQLPA